MSNEEFIDVLEIRLEQLSNTQVVEFALNICKRLLPHYIRFYNKYGWGDIEALSESILYCEKFKDQQDIEVSKLQSLTQQTEAAMPDTEEFENGSLALNASAAILELTEYMFDADLSHILNISSYMTDTIDFIARENAIGLPANHQELIKEREYQLELIS